MLKQVKCLFVFCLLGILLPTFGYATEYAPKADEILLNGQKSEKTMFDYDDDYHQILFKNKENIYINYPYGYEFHYP